MFFIQRFQSVMQRYRFTAAALCCAVFVAWSAMLPAAGTCQEKFPDKIYPRTDSWSIKCKVYRMTETTVILMFPGHDNPSEVQRTSLSKIEFGDGRQVFFNKQGQIESEISIPEPVYVVKVLNPGLLRLRGGEEVVLNGIDFQLPADSLSLHYFQMGTEFLRSMVEGAQVTLQFDLQRRDEFGRFRAYVLTADGTMINAEIIKQGFCRLDRGRPLMYLDDFKALEAQAQREKRGIWLKN